jgi:hypothetical protein
MQPKRPFLLRTPGLLIIATILLLYVLASKPPADSLTKACCGPDGALKVNGHMVCANPSESVCTVDVSPKVELKCAVMMQYTNQPNGANGIITASVLGGVMGLGTAVWLINTGVTERVADRVIDIVGKFLQTALAYGYGRE